MSKQRWIKDRIYWPIIIEGDAKISDQARAYDIDGCAMIKVIDFHTFSQAMQLLESCSALLYVLDKYNEVNLDDQKVLNKIRSEISAFKKEVNHE